MLILDRGSLYPVGTQVTPPGDAEGAVSARVVVF